MWTTGSTTDLFLFVSNDTGTAIAYAMIAIIGGTIALMGVGFGIHQLKKHIYFKDGYIGW